MSGLELLSPDHRRLFIGGSWREANSGATFKVRDPADGSVITEVADGDVNDAVDALDAAVAVQQEWGTTAPRERGEILRRAFELITERADDFAELMSLEMGKTVKEAKGEVTYGAEFFRWFSEEAVRIHGRWMQAPAGGSRLLTIKKPVGPCLFITPWNFPLAMGTRKIGPAIAAGCTMVVKPAELTPLTMLALAATLEEVGLPAGVLNIVTTSDSKSLSKALMADDRLRKVSFTGSTTVGKVIIRQSADELQRVSMELGGNAPFIVFEDADVDAAVDGAMIAKMRNMGEACTAANRFLVHESVAGAFAEKLGARMGALVVGRGQDDGVDVGPLIDQNAVDSVSQLVTDAVHDGARVITGGTPGDGPGHFYPPTVLVDVPAESEIVRQEIFGPVAPITTFSSEEEAIAAANDTEYGLASYVYTRDLARTIRVAERLQFGMVGINSGLISNAAAPFGGVKASGFGREGSFEGIDEYLDTDVRRPARRLTPRRWRSTATPRRSTATSPPRPTARPASATGRCRSPTTPRCSRGCRPSRSASARPTWCSRRPAGTAYPPRVRTPACAPRCSVTTTGPSAPTILERATQTNEVGRLATLYPALREIQPGAGPLLALLEVGASAGLCLYPDRYLVRWTFPYGRARGRPTRSARCSSARYDRGADVSGAGPGRLAGRHRPRTSRRHRRRGGPLAGDDGLARAGGAPRAAAPAVRDRPRRPAVPRPGRPAGRPARPGRAGAAGGDAGGLPLRRDRLPRARRPRALRER